MPTSMEDPFSLLSALSVAIYSPPAPTEKPTASHDVTNAVAEV